MPFCLNRRLPANVLNDMFRLFDSRLMVFLLNAFNGAKRLNVLNWLNILAIFYLEL